MSCDDTARINSDGEGKRCSIFFDWRICGSLVEKKKFSSTTGLKLTRVATRPNNTTVKSSTHQCAPSEAGLTMEQRLADPSGQPMKLRETRGNTTESKRQPNQDLTSGRASINPAIDHYSAFSASRRSNLSQTVLVREIQFLFDAFPMRFHSFCAEVEIHCDPSHFSSISDQMENLEFARAHAGDDGMGQIAFGRTS